MEKEKELNSGKKNTTNTTKFEVTSGESGKPRVIKISVSHLGLALSGGAEFAVRGRAWAFSRDWREEGSSSGSITCPLFRAEVTSAAFGRLGDTGTRNQSNPTNGTRSMDSR